MAGNDKGPTSGFVLSFLQVGFVLLCYLVLLRLPLPPADGLRQSSVPPCVLLNRSPYLCRHWVEGAERLTPVGSDLLPESLAELYSAALRPEIAAHGADSLWDWVTGHSPVPIPLRGIIQNLPRPLPALLLP
jgi:hypothetical protein